MKKKKTLFVIGLLSLVMVAAACGQKKGSGPGQSFGQAAAAAATLSPQVSASPAAQATPTATPAATAQPVAEPSPSASPAASASNAPSPSPAASAQPAASPAPSAKPSPTLAAAADATPAAQPAAETAPAQPQATPQPSAKAAPVKLTNEINWSQFFDNDKQDRPSEHFWDLTGKTVQIKGFMGEVLSFDKHWFLLIPQPGAECPFDNGDETYWNKIMIVFVPDTVKLRYTSGPLLITGKLDVGIKLDESGYKTMFRMYDASFEKIKE